MTDPIQRMQLFNLLAELPPGQFEALLFALNPPAGNISSANASQAQRVGELLRWAESPIGCELYVVANLARTKFKLDVPNFPQLKQTPLKEEQPPPETQATDWQESLGNGVFLDMVHIPGGRFWMGSPASEAERQENEGPVHSVTVPAFAMGKYPVTQMQWSEVAALPKLTVELNPFPSRFQGAQRPVEQVSWFEVVEFCERLSRYRQRPYRLPSEAEWEYACRARTTTPFYFGDTITPDQANYDGNYTYGSGPKGLYRKQTSDVGSFPANGFGLYDMHSNVWEWCQDVSHDSYQDAPINGSAWLEGGDQNRRMLRGGSWVSLPRNCRSASRDYLSPGYRFYLVGFRVVCEARRTLQ